MATYKHTTAIAITGGIASGKSLVCSIFASMGHFIVNADKLVHDLYCNDSFIQNRITERYGNHLKKSDGAIDRAVLAQIVWNCHAEMIWLQQLIYPPLMKKINQLKLEVSPHHLWYLIEIPLLIEQKWFHLCSESICVFAPIWVRYQRLREERGLERSIIEKCLSSQTKDQSRWQQCDYFIYSGDGIDQTRLQVEGLSRYLTRKYG